MAIAVVGQSISQSKTKNSIYDSYEKSTSQRAVFSSKESLMLMICADC